MMRALFVLTPTESKRLIAKGVVALPEVQQALSGGTIIVSWGSTCSYVASELVGEDIECRRFMAGYVEEGELKVSDGVNRINPIILQNGKRVDLLTRDVLEEFGGDDVFIKGANAIDPQGNTGILLRHEAGGTIGMSLGILAARGSHLILPVGLEKLIPSMKEATNTCGLHTVEYASGVEVGLMPVMYGRAITEIDAVRILTGADAVHIASGGLGNSQGAVTLAVSGDKADVEKTIDIIENIKSD
jgi:hypothetical protein